VLQIPCVTGRWVRTLLETLQGDRSRRGCELAFLRRGTSDADDGRGQGCGGRGRECECRASNDSFARVVLLAVCGDEPERVRVTLTRDQLYGSLMKLYVAGMGDLVRSDDHVALHVVEVVRAIQLRGHQAALLHRVKPSRSLSPRSRSPSPRNPRRKAAAA